MAKMPDAKRPMFTSETLGETVTVQVGPAPKPYILHKALLVQDSEYFRKALDGQFKEAKEGIVKLPDVEEEIFQVFVGWLYTRKIPEDKSQWQVVQDKAKAAGRYWAASMVMVKTCGLADRFDINPLQTAMIDELCRLLSTRRPWYGTVIYAFDNLPAESAVLRLLVDSHCRRYSPNADRKEDILLRSKLPHEFLVRVMIAYAGGARDRNSKLDPCDYHNHASEEERSECVKKGEGA